MEREREGVGGSPVFMLFIFVFLSCFFIENGLSPFSLEMSSIGWDNKTPVKSVRMSYPATGKTFFLF